MVAYIVYLILALAVIFLVALTLLVIEEKRIEEAPFDEFANIENNVRKDYDYTVSYITDDVKQESDSYLNDPTTYPKDLTDFVSEDTYNSDVKPKMKKTKKSKKKPAKKKTKKSK